LEKIPFAEVAKAHSHGPTASSGGVHRPTHKGSLKSKILERAIFTQPVGEMGPPLEDEQGFHIVRVIAREDGGLKSFEDVQDEIHEKLVLQRRTEKVRDYMDRLREAIPVQTIFEDKVALRRFNEQLDQLGPVARR
jgi:parvulin-like peptidyl-prolyl isomerase